MSELLDLSTIAAPRDTIRLPSKRDPEGKTYEIVNPTDLGILALRRLYQLQEEENRLRESAQKSDLTAKQKSALKKCLGDALTILMPTLEPATLELLPVEARERIVLAWTLKHYNADDGEGSAEGETSSRRTTAASSRGSKRSTAATRKTGSTSRSTS